MVREAHAQLKGVLKMEPGKRVQVQGLKNQADLNGLHGHLLQFDAAKMRWAVELGNGRKVLLKLSNLLPLDTEVTPARPGAGGFGPAPATEHEAIASVNDEEAATCTDEPCAAQEPVAIAAEAAATVIEEQQAEQKQQDENEEAAAAPAGRTESRQEQATEEQNQDAAAAPAGHIEARSEETRSQDERPEGVAEPPPLNEDDWPVLPATEEQQAKARSGRWFDNESAAEFFAEQLRDNDPSLRSLCLVPPKRFNEEDAREISKALLENKHCSELLASGHSLSEQSCKDLAGMLRNNDCLQMLSIGDSSLGDTARIIFDGLAQNKSLTSLDLEHKGLTAAAVAALAQALTARNAANAAQLKTLRLSRNPGLVDALRDLVAVRPPPEEVLLSECGLQAVHGPLLGEWVSAGVCDLDLRGNSSFGADGIESLLLKLQKERKHRPGATTSLRRLRLDNCAVGDDGLEALADACKQGVIELEELFLEHCEITKVGCEALAPALRGPRKLRRLSVRANVIGDEGCELLGDCSERLDLSATSLSGSVLPLLGSKDLVSLEMFSNPMLGPSVRTWCAELRIDHWRTLEYLDMSGCALGTDGFSCFCEALLAKSQLMPNLTYLCLGGNDVEHVEKWDDLAEALTAARAGELRVVWKDT